MIYKQNFSFLRDHGYDIWVIDWKESTRSMKDNGNSLVEFLTWLKGKYQGPDMEPFVVMGESMGGIIARYALCYMEQNQTANYPENSHNVRTLITIDSPHQGANIPLSFQYLYENVVKDFKSKAYLVAGFMDFYNLVTLSRQGNLNIPMVNYGSTLLKRPAVKELLLLHLYTKNSNNQFTRHPDADDFWNELQALGNYPTTCKLIAQANGSLSGSAQSHLQSTRVPGDVIGYMTADIGIRIFGKRIPIYGTILDLRTNKEGDPNFRAFRFDRGVYSFKIRYRNGRIQFNRNWRPTHQADGYVNAKPYCVSSGSTQKTLTLENNYDKGFRINLGGLIEFKANSDQILTDRCPTRFSSDLNILNGTLGIGINYLYCSDGPFFSFVPVASAIDDVNGVDNSLNKNYWTMNIADKLARTPFHAFMGPSYNTAIDSNFNHLHTVNSITKFYLEDVVPFNPAYFQTAECKGIPGFFLNKEIGTNNLFLNNVNFNYNTSFHVPDTIFGDRLYRHTDYNNYGSWYINWQTTQNSSTNFGLYSKDEPAITSNGAVVNLFNNKINRNEPNAFNEIFTGYLDANTGNKDVKVCCNLKSEYAIGRYAAQIKDSVDLPASLALYPNPLVNSNILKGELRGAYGIYTPIVVSLLGKTITYTKKISSTYFSLDLGNLNAGIYKLILISNNNKILTQTFIKQ